MLRAYSILVFAVLIVAGASCVQGSDESETRPIAFFEAASGKIFIVDKLGSRTPLQLTPVPGLGPFQHLNLFLPLALQGMITLTDGGTVTIIYPQNFQEQPLAQLTVPGGIGIIRARQGWAAQKLYVLTHTADRGVVMDVFDVIEVGDTVAMEPLDDLGPGLEKPVSFDLASGGNQVFILYESGKLAARNLYMDDDVEGEIADFGPGAKDLHVMPDQSMFVAGGQGLYRLAPGGAPELLVDAGPLTLCRVRDQSVTDVYFVTAAGEVYNYNLDTGLPYFFLTNPDYATAILPIEYHWVKNTRPIFEAPLTTPPYYTLIPNPYLVLFQDPEGDSADVTVRLEADPAQGVYLVGSLSNDTVLVYDDVVPGAPVSASFYGGVLAGTVTIRIEAVSSDGQTSRFEDQLVVEDLGIPPIP